MLRNVGEYEKLWKGGLEHREQYEREWKDVERKYDGALIYNRADWQSNVSMMGTYEDIETMVSKQLRLMFKSRLFSIESRLPADEGKVIKFDKVIEYQDLSVPRRQEKLETLLRYKYGYGTGIGKVWWDENLNQPNYKQVDPFCFIIEPWVEGLDEAKWVMEEMLVTKDYAREMFKEHWKPEGDSVDDILASGAKLSRENDGQDMGNLVHVTEYWEDGWYAVILNKKYVVRSEENPYTEMGMKPYFSTCCLTRARTFWGNGLTTPFLPLADAEDQVLNMSLDLSRLRMNPHHLIGQRAGLESGGIEIQVGGNTEVMNINEIMSIKHDGADGALAASQNILRGVRERGTGLGSYNTGENRPANNDTAGGTAIMAEKAAERLATYIDKDEFMLKRLGTMWVRLNKQYLFSDADDGSIESGEKSVKIKDKWGIRTEKLTVDDIFSEVDVNVKMPSQVMNHLGYAQVITGAFPNLSKMPNIDQDQLVRVYVEALQIPNPEALILTNQEQIEKARQLAEVKAMSEVQAKLAQMEAQQKEAELAKEFAPEISGQSGTPIAPPAEPTAGSMVQPGMETNQAAITNTPVP